MLALLDADILPYELGAVYDETVSQGTVYQAVDERIEFIKKRSGSSDIKCFLTESKSNFRFKIATVDPYKGTRPTEKPPHWMTIRVYLEMMYDPEVVPGYEADDIIAEYHKQNEDTIICSRDKDLDTITGWHYRWPCGERQPERRYYVNPFDAWRFFYYQLLIGDKVDNIRGVFGIGNKKAETILSKCETKEEMHKAVLGTYIDRYGDGLDEPIYYESVSKHRCWKKPSEIMYEMAELLYLGVDRDHLRRLFNEVQV